MFSKMERSFSMPTKSRRTSLLTRSFSFQEKMFSRMFRSEDRSTPRSPESKSSQCNGKRKSIFGNGISCAVSRLQKSLGYESTNRADSADLFSSRRSKSDFITRKWERVVLKLLSGREQNGNFPLNRREVFDEIESKYRIKLNETEKWIMHEEFAKVEMESGNIKISDLQYLLERIGMDMGDDNLDKILKDILKAQIDVLEDSENGCLNFEMFLTIACEISIMRAQRARDESTLTLKNSIPLNPDSIYKQGWDALCLVLLLYCSFYVPYSLAFDTSSFGDSSSPTDVVDILINCIFMIDIGLTFLTAYYDKQGFLVKDMRRISTVYLEGWFIPDLAGRLRPWRRAHMHCIAALCASL